MSPESVSLVVPTFREAEGLADHLLFHLEHFDVRDLVVVDGTSPDGTANVARRFGPPVRVLQVSPGGRARQLRHGVRAARGDWILMLHADTRLPPDFELESIPKGRRQWGWFDCRLDGGGLIYRLLERGISLRSALFSSPTGDQAIWVHRDLLEAVGGVPRLPIMEDVELARRLRRREAGRRNRTPVSTSARRWREQGVWRTILLMWGLKLAYYAGVSPERLKRWYA